MSAFERIVRVRLSGRVQGVGFRAFIQRHAEARGVVGWVRNRRDGDVEAVFAGSEHAVAALCEACRRGPLNAFVARLDVEDADCAAFEEADAARAFLQRATR